MGLIHEKKFTITTMKYKLHTVKHVLHVSHFTNSFIKSNLLNVYIHLLFHVFYCEK